MTVTASMTSKHVEAWGPRQVGDCGGVPEEVVALLGISDCTYLGRANDPSEDVAAWSVEVQEAERSDYTDGSHGGDDEEDGFDDYDCYDNWAGW